MDDAELLADVARAYPDFVVKSWRPLGEGWMSRALLINEDRVFRFAKYQEAAADLAKEAAILPLLATRLTLAVPRFELIGSQQNGLSFVSYPLLAGTPLTADTLSALGERERERVAQQIAHFMDEMQTIPIASLAATGLVPVDLTAHLGQHLRALLALKSELPSHVAKYVERRFHEYIAEPSFRSREPRLLHADLSPDHWLFAQNRGELSGIIDFGDCMLSDPDYEYLYLLEDAGRDFTRRVMQIRSVDDTDSLLRKVEYFVTFDHVQSILMSKERGIAHWRDEGVQALAAQAEEH